ncbi:MAG TPA: FAD-dependent oxidoreductase, partial [Candidatus Binatus sp.]|nr:FAD-dependent oxidoreductase [Candidatus Binatus sp.]
MRITVIGAGINGLASAWALVRDGHDVTVVEQGPIPNPLGSSYDQNRLIRFPYGASDGYTSMVTHAYRAWDLVWQDLGETLYARTGTLAIARSDDSWTDASAQTLQRKGIESKRLTPADIERIFPMLRADGIRYALYLESGGELFASRILESLSKFLRARGARLLEHTQVRDVDVERARAALKEGPALEA